MIQPFVRLLALTALVSGCAGPAAAPATRTSAQSLEAAPLAAAELAEAPGPELGFGTIQTDDGQVHSYFFRVPAGEAPAAGRPVLIWLHGDGGTGQGLGAGFYPYTDPDGAVIVTPNGTDRTWTHAVGDLPGASRDAQFVSLLIDQLVGAGAGTARIDPERVYLGGESRGAYLPYYLLMRASTKDRLAAVAVNAGTVYCQPADVECNLDAPQLATAAILHLQDTLDPDTTPVPLSSFHAPIDWNDDWRVFFPLKLWAQQNGCFGGDNSTLKDDGVLLESATVGGKPAALYDLSSWGPACNKYQLLLVTGNTPGHVLPGQHARIWQFLSRYDLHGVRVPQRVEPAPAPDPGGSTARPAGNLSRGFFVSAGRLYDSLGNDFVMRGINHPLAWHPGQALHWLDEVALTGANSVRLVWQTDGSVPLLGAAIARSIALRMIPIVELHDATGPAEPAQLLRMAQYYASDLHDLLLSFEDHLLVNIANEWTAEEPSYSETYARAIQLLRDAGIHHTLVIDASDWGQGSASLFAAGPGLLEGDPEHNLLFSLHMYAQHFADADSIRAALGAAVEAQLPLIVGEFGSAEFLESKEPGVIPFQVLLEEAERLRLGVLAWVWTGFGDETGSLDLSADGSAGSLTSWGDSVVNGAFGIRSTSHAASVFPALPAPAAVPPE